MSPQRFELLLDQYAAAKASLPADDDESQEKERLRQKLIAAYTSVCKALEACRE